MCLECDFIESEPMFNWQDHNNNNDFKCNKWIINDLLGFGWSVLHPGPGQKQKQNKSQ